MYDKLTIYSHIPSNTISYSESSVITFTTGPSYACLAWKMYMRVANPMRPTNSTHAQLKFTGVTSYALGKNDQMKHQHE
jgi:hypothetical protein